MFIAQKMAEILIHLHELPLRRSLGNAHRRVVKHRMKQSFAAGDRLVLVLNILMVGGKQPA